MGVEIIKWVANLKIHDGNSFLIIYQIESVLIPETISIVINYKGWSLNPRVHDTINLPISNLINNLEATRQLLVSEFKMLLNVLNEYKMALPTLAFLQLRMLFTLLRCDGKDWQ